MSNTTESEGLAPTTLAEGDRSQRHDCTVLTVMPGSAEDFVGLRENRSPITREILESFLACKTKAYLKLHAQQGIKSDFEMLSTEIRDELRDQAFENLVSRVKPTDVMRGVTIRSGWSSWKRKTRSSSHSGLIQKTRRMRYSSNSC
jgi:hypothetical protein